MSLELKIIPPLQVLLAGAGMWLTSAHVPLPTLRYHAADGLFYGLLLAALAVFCLAVFQFWRHRTTINPLRIANTSSLITSGVYAFSRNPIYLADVLILLAWWVRLGAWINLLWIAAFIWYLTRFQIQPEERMLARKFGAQWESYRYRVRRWI